MPKVIAEIKTFNLGIISTPDTKDIPSQAADYSLDIETITSEGKIKGRKTDSYLSAFGGFSTGGVKGVSSVTLGKYIAPSGGGIVD
tara:strand:+ start:19 stop:276 length:258 start_codon:yes stop_codon:yes gene_type:complete